MAPIKSDQCSSHKELIDAVKTLTVKVSELVINVALLTQRIGQMEATVKEDHKITEDTDKRVDKVYTIGTVALFLFGVAVKKGWL